MPTDPLTPAVPDGGEPPAPADGSATHEQRRDVVGMLRPMIGPLALVAIVAFFGIRYPDTFLTRTNLVTNVLEVVAFLIIVAAGQTVVMVVGEFDLSVGGVAALSTAVTASFIATSTLDGQPQQPGSVFWSVLLGLAIGVGCGLLNGVLVAYLGVLAFIATLGMAQVFTSLANRRVDGKPVFGLVDHNFVDIARGDLLGVSNKIWISMAFAVVIWLLLDRTTFGRRMYAVGGNAHAAYLSGINGRRVRLAAFAIAGLSAALGGILQAATTATANTSAPQPWMLQSIAGVFLGMAMFRSGRPNLPGTVLGVVMLRTLDNGLNFTDLNDYVQNAISGAAIVLAVLPPALARLRAAR
jgi:ribose transport system permease protein